MQILRRLLLQTLLLLTVYEAVRVLFWLINRAQFDDSSHQLLLQAFFHGARYDLAAIVLTNAALFLFYLLPCPQRWFRWQELSTALGSGLINGFFLAVNIVDVEYYRFTGKRFTRDSFRIAQDILSQIVQLAVYYWYYTLLILLIAAGIGYLTAKILRRTSRDKPWSHAVGAVIILALLSLAGRGGWQTKPLIPAQAYAGDTGSLGILILNSSFTLLKSSDKALLQSYNWMTDEEARRILLNNGQGSSIALQKRPRNIVLMILESFGKEYVFPPNGQPSFTPFLQSLALKGSYFPNAFANGRRSIDALPAILAGIPAWMEAPFITSPYQTNRVQGYPSILKEQGMRTQFFHGGDNGTMFFDVMADRFGFEQYVGAREYPASNDHDGRWGIFDEPFLQYVVKRLGEDGRAFFASIFTLSSHHPYTIPLAYKDRFPKGQLEIHESLGYADLSLQKFYASAQKQSWFQDTLFVFTADHTQKTQFPEYETVLGHYRVPLLFIMNDQPLPFLGREMPVQHLDIMPTVLDALGVEPTSHSRFGSSLLKNTSRPGIILYDLPRYLLVGESKLLSWNLETNRMGIYDWQKDVLLKSERSFTEMNDPQLKYIQAHAQCFNNGMVQNRLLW